MKEVHMNKFNRRLSTKILTIFLSILLVAPYAFAGEVGKVTYVEGRVDVLRQDASMAAPIREGEMISVGESLRTKSKSKVEVKFNDGTILRLAQNSKVEIKDYQLDEDKKRKAATIRLDRGKARTIIAKMSTPSDFIITTPNAEGRVKGSDIFAFYQAGNSGMLVSQGRLSVANIAHPENAVTVPAGNSVLVPLEELPKGPRPYFELEKKLHEQDTSVPVTRIERGTIIKGTVTKVSGDVKVTTKGASASHVVNINEVLGEGDRIETGEDGLIEIGFDNGNAVNLKPNTNLKIGKLVFDPATGEYENLFESNAGKIRARIENLKGKSKFEIKTPIAVSGARGTIMYHSILPGLVRTFFEGGGGYITNLISGMTENIGAGQNVSTDNQGNVSDAAYTSDADREAYGEGWDPGSGVEGYSEPEGTTGTYLYGDDTGTGAPGGADAPDTGAGAGEFFDDLPITETGATTTTTTTTTPVLEAELASSGYLYNSIEYFGDYNGYFEGLIGVVGPMWGDGATSDFASIGKFNSWGDEPFIWYSGGDSLYNSLYSYDPFNETYTTYDNGNGVGAFYGITGGIGGDGELEGKAFALYIDPDGNAGILSGDLTGVYSDDLEMYLLEGTLTNTLMAQDIGISPEDLIDELSWAELYASGIGGFDGGGNIEVSDLFGMTLSIYDQAWGIWGAVAGGEYSEPTSPWRLALGGYIDYYGYWLGTVDGSEWEDGRLVGQFRGIWLIPFGGDSEIMAGSIDGDVIGNYIEVEEGSGTWQAVAAGEWVEVTELLDQYEMFGKGGLETLDDFLSMPITEVYSNVLTGSNSFINTATMDISLYQNEFGNIWAALFGGTYAGDPTGAWSLTLNGTGSGDTVTLNDGTWSGGNWIANVGGTVGGNNVTGQAGGTYGDGNFSGVGAGTWTAPEL